VRLSTARLPASQGSRQTFHIYFLSFIAPILHIRSNFLNLAVDNYSLGVKKPGISCGVKKKFNLFLVTTRSSYNLLGEIFPRHINRKFLTCIHFFIYILHNHFKRTVAGDILVLAVFIKQTHLGPWYTHTIFLILWFSILPRYLNLKLLSCTWQIHKSFICLLLSEMSQLCSLPFVNTYNLIPNT
jgi:hypothetical protein